MNQVVPIISAAHLPALVQADGAQTSTRFWEFFVNQIRNPHARGAYASAM